MRDGLKLVKMSGAGNDFVVLGPAQTRRIAGRETEFARGVCRRGLSVGADGLLLVDAAPRGRVRVRFHNPDGSAAFCGNGSRCAARFAHAQQLAGDSMILETAIGDVAADVRNARVRLTLPPPTDEGAWAIEVDERKLTGQRILAGVPHFVVFVDDPGDCPLERWGPAVRHHPSFGAQGTNLDVVGRGSGGALLLRTWERGVERETLACGSGALAAAFAVRMSGAGERFCVIPASGVPLEVELPGPAHAPSTARLTGDARFVFEGELDAEGVPGFSLE